MGKNKNILSAHSNQWKRKFLLSFLGSIGLFFSVSGQDPNWEKGELESVEIEIDIERKITLPQVNRNFEKIPPRASEPITPPISYSFLPLSFQTVPVKPLIKPLKVKQETPPNVWGGYLKGGYGNFVTPYLEGYINSVRDKSKLVGAHAWLKNSGKGPVDAQNSASGNYGLSVFGKTFSQVFSLGGDVSYENVYTHFYGYPEGLEVMRDTIRHAFDKFRLGMTFGNAKNSNFQYELGGNFNYLSDNFSARETEVVGNLGLKYNLDEQQAVQLKVKYFLINRKDELVAALPRNLLDGHIFYTFKPTDESRLTLGARVVYENDSIDNKDLHFYPDVSAAYTISPSVELVGSFSGGIDKVSLHSLIQDNLWLAPNIPIYHTNRKIETTASLRAKLGAKTLFQTGISLGSFENMVFFVNDSIDQAVFQTTYDRGTTKRSNLFISLSLAQARKGSLLLRGDAFNYSTNSLQEPWHRPSYRVSLSGSYNIVEKILVSMNFVTQGGMKAYDYTSKKVISLDEALDLSFKVEYIFSDSFSLFADFRNVLGNAYPIYLNYPVRGFQGLGGLTWSF